jgi:hypothetical protein
LPTRKAAIAQTRSSDLVVGEHGGDGGDEADRGGEQRFRDARRHHREIGVVHRGDGGKTMHDTPDGAKEADKGRGRADGGEKNRPALQPLHLALDGHRHRPIDALAHARAGDIGAGDAQAAPPLRHRRAEHGGDRVGRLGAFLLVKLIKAATRPETVLEAVGGAADAAQRQPFLEHDRPYPDACREQQQHDEFDDDIGLHEETPER